MLYRASAQVPSDAAIISKAIDKHGTAFLKQKNVRSVSIGVLKDGTAYTGHFGELEKGKGNPPDNETIYEIASVTKTMTGYLVARAVMEGKLGLEDDVRTYLEGDYSNLEFNGQPIRLQHLLTHTSGMPTSLPVELNGVFDTLDESVPKRYYEIEASYNKEKFFEDLKKVSLKAKPGTNYFYSNAGAELIGYILEKVYGRRIDDLLRKSFLEQYTMGSTGIILSETQKKRLVCGYWMGNSKPSPNQRNPLWASGSGVKMSLSDMLRYMELQLNSENPIVRESRKVLYQEGKTLKVNYFWRVWTDKYGTSYNHHGGTTGMQNWLFIFPDHNLGISIITNQSSTKIPGLLSKTARKLLKDIIKV